jgi:hypothetical protein
MSLNEEEEEGDLFSRLLVLLTSIAYLKSTPFRSCELWLYCRLLVKCITPITWFLSKDEGFHQQLVKFFWSHQQMKRDGDDSQISVSSPFRLDFI